MAARVDVVGADRRGLSVEPADLRVKRLGAAPLVDLGAGFHHVFVVRPAGDAGLRVIVALDRVGENLHFHAPAARCDDRVFQRRGRDEIRAFEDDFLGAAVHILDEQVENVVIVGSRRECFEETHAHVLEDGWLVEVDRKRAGNELGTVRKDRQLLGLVLHLGDFRGAGLGALVDDKTLPVVLEQLADIIDDGAGHHHVGVAPTEVLDLAFRVFRGHVHAADDRNAFVNNQHLLVRPIIRLQRISQKRVVDQHLDAAVLHAPDDALAATEGEGIVDDDAHVDTVLHACDQQVGHLVPDFVVVPEQGLNADIGLRGGDDLEPFREARPAVHEHRDGICGNQSRRGLLVDRPFLERVGDDRLILIEEFAKPYALDAPAGVRNEPFRPSGALHWKSEPGGLRRGLPGGDRGEPFRFERFSLGVDLRFEVVLFYPCECLTPDLRVAGRCGEVGQGLFRGLDGAGALHQEFGEFPGGFDLQLGLEYTGNELLQLLDEPRRIRFSFRSIHFHQQVLECLPLGCQTPRRRCGDRFWLHERIACVGCIESWFRFDFRGKGR
ncbi:MAG: hypothetical protein BWY66_01489 [bacterium ADurb.Bin374]|nr:MAG: hypothetical protein BWY66_01489 [bacterium ADurb.Bin374]